MRISSNAVIRCTYLSSSHFFDRLSTSLRSLSRFFFLKKKQITSLTLGGENKFIFIASNHCNDFQKRSINEKKKKMLFFLAKNVQKLNKINNNNCKKKSRNRREKFKYDSNIM